MVYVRLEKTWTDGDGATHTAGSMVEVDAATLAELEEGGVVAEADVNQPQSGASWGGPTSDPSGGATVDSGASWGGPTSDPTGGSGG